MKNICGVCPVIAMPFTEAGEVDYQGFERLVGHLANTGVNGLTLFGIASEFHKLTDAEKYALAERFTRQLKETPVFSMLSVTDHSLEVAVQRAKSYEALGADCLMVLPPFFLSPTQESIKAHVTAVAAAVHIPVLIQYAPNETNIGIPVEEWTAIYDQCPRVMFKIEANPPIDYIHQLLAARKTATVFVGYAGLYMLEVLAIGGQGVMPGCSFAEIYQRIYALYQTDRSAAALLHQRLFCYISEWMTDCEYIIQVEKTILYQRGLISADYCRQPGKVLSAHDRQRITQFLDEFAADLGEGR